MKGCLFWTQKSNGIHLAITVSKPEYENITLTLSRMWNSAVRHLVSVFTPQSLTNLSVYRIVNEVNISLMSILVACFFFAQATYTLLQCWLANLKPSDIDILSIYLGSIWAKINSCINQYPDCKLIITVHFYIFLNLKPDNWVEKKLVR